MPNEDKIVVLSSDKYPGNSDRSKNPNAKPNPNPRPRRGQIATAKRIKKPFFTRFAETFLEPGTGQDVSNYIIHDVVIPAAKSTIVDLVEGAIEMVLFGGEGGGRSRHASRQGSRSFVSYNSMYEGSTRRGVTGRPPVRRPFNVDRGVPAISRAGIESIVLGSRQEAETVLGEMIELLSEYGTVSVADLYDLTGLSSEFTDNKYGWTDLQPCSTHRERNGWILELPRPVVLED